MNSIEDFAKDCVGNWQKFGSFAWYNSPEDAANWTIVYTHQRDSSILDESNAEQIAKCLKPFTEGDDPDAVAESHNHWAVGWIAGYTIRVYKNGEITPAFREWYRIQEELDDYPILDDDDYSSKEYAATIANIESAGYGKIKDDLPKNWAYDVYSWFSENNDLALENTDDQGGYPSGVQMETALKALDYFDNED